jgi:hypothetical protein
MRRLSSLSWIALFAVIAGIGVFLAPAQSQPRPADDSLTAQPGYVDVSTVDSWFDTEASTEVDIRGPLVNLVAEASQSSNPDFARLMGDVRGIQVRGYPLSEDAASSIAAETDAFGKRLESSGWQRVIYVRDGDERVQVYIREANSMIAGLTLLSTKPGDECVLVNIVGSLSPDQIAQLGRGLNLSALEQVDVSKNTPQ